MAQAVLQPGEERTGNDYIIGSEGERPAPPIRSRVVGVLRIILVLIVAAVSLALFWVVWTVLGLI